MPGDILVEMRQICKSFDGNPANDRVDLTLRAGEVHVILGENGAGKSTLMSILAGVYRADAGEIWVRGHKTNFLSPRDAIDAGVGMVHQHFRLVPSLSVAENIVLGTEQLPFWLEPKKTEAAIRELSARFGLAVDPAARVYQLSIGEQQRVEILKMLYRGSQILILDEPTAVLTPQEVADLFATLRRMAADNRAVVIITHKLREVLAVADRVTVLRGGRQVAEVPRSEMNEGSLARAMVGREFSEKQRKAAQAQGGTVLELSHVGANNEKGLAGLKDVSFTVCAGEILGIAGVAGNGQRELCEVIAGLRPLTAGKVILGGQEITGATPKAIIKAGVSYIPEDRLGTGLVPGLGITDNIVLKDYHRQRSRLLIDYPAARAKAAGLIQSYRIQTTNLNRPVKLLSGGNLQRLLLAREMAAGPRLIVAAYPVRGLDIEATIGIRNILLERREQGAAILLISEDLDELFQLSDRIAVLYDGEIQAILPTDTATPEGVGRLMVGAKTLEEKPL